MHECLYIHILKGDWIWSDLKVQWRVHKILYWRQLVGLANRLQKNTNPTSNMLVSLLPVQSCLRMYTNEQPIRAKTENRDHKDRGVSDIQEKQLCHMHVNHFRTLSFCWFFFFLKSSRCAGYARKQSLAEMAQRNHVHGEWSSAAILPSASHPAAVVIRQWISLSCFSHEWICSACLLYQQWVCEINHHQICE